MRSRTGRMACVALGTAAVLPSATTYRVGAETVRQSSFLVWDRTTMRWLIIVGVSVDLAGAALVGWSVYAQSAAERREEALTRMGGNFWVTSFARRSIRAAATRSPAASSIRMISPIRFAATASGFTIERVRSMAMVDRFCELD